MISTLLARTLCVAALMSWAPVAVASAASDTPPIPPAAERYARAARLLYWPTASAVRNAAIIPQWIGQTDRFWYRKEVPGGARFLVVDPDLPDAVPAFDHAAMARTLSARTGQSLTPDTLPFTAIEMAPDLSEVTVAVAGKRYACSRAATTCRPAGAAPGPEWLVAPGGRWMVRQQAGNLLLKDSETGEERLLTGDGSPMDGWAISPEPSNFRALSAGSPSQPPFMTWWSPDGRTLLTVRVDQRHVAPYPYLDFAPAEGGRRPVPRDVRLPMPGEAGARAQLHLIDMGTGRTQAVDLDQEDLAVTTLGPQLGQWSGDGATFFLFARSPALDRARLFAVDRQTGRVRTVMDEQGVHPAVLAATDYGAPLAGIVAGGSRFVWPSANSGFLHLYLHDTRTGRRLATLTRGAWTVRDLLRIDEAGGRLWFIASGRDGGDPYARSLYEVRLDGSGLRLLSPEPADKPLASPPTRMAFDGSTVFDPVSPSGRWLVYPVSSLESPPRLILRDSRGERPARVIETAEADQLFALGYRAPEPFTVSAPDGQMLYGVVYRPSFAQPGQRLPVLLAQYNSPLTPYVPRHFTSGYNLIADVSSLAALAELGFIVVAVDPRGTPYRGRRFSDPPKGFLADMGVSDQVHALRRLAERDPGMDLGRLGIIGASFGGWTSIRALIEHPDVFRAGVAWAPPGSFRTMWSAPALTSPMGPAVLADGTASPLWTAMESPAQVDRIRGRLLVSIGGLDENVLPGSTLAFLDAAARADRNVDMLFLPRATHGPIPYWPYAVKRSWDFLLVHVAGELPPEDFRFPAGSFPP